MSGPRARFVKVFPFVLHTPPPRSPTELLCELLCRTLVAALVLTIPFGIMGKWVSVWSHSLPVPAPLPAV